MPTGQQYSSTAPQTNLVGGINASQLTATVVSFTGWPATPFTGAWDIGQPTQELVDVTGVSGNAITAMTRGIDGSSGQNHSNNATFTHVVIGRDAREARAHIDASASNDSTGHAVHGLTSGSSVVGTTDTQTLTNKTLTSPVITGLSAANPAITGTVTGGAQYQNITAGTTAVGSVPFIAKGLASQTADLFRVTDNVPNVLVKVAANGATGSGATTIAPTDTGNTSLSVRSPSTAAWPFQAFSNGTERLRVDGNGQVTVFTGAFAQSGQTGAATASRYVGGTAGGPPTTQTWTTGDFVVDTVNGILWTCTSGGTPGTWRASGKALLASQILGGTAASVTFNSIPQYFNHLEVVVVAKTNSSTVAGYDNLQLQINGVSTGQYDTLQEFETIGSSTVTGFTATGSTVSIVGTVWGNHFATQGAGYTEICLPYYSTTTFGKGWNSRSIASDGGSTGQKTTAAGAFNTANSTAAITSLTLSASAGSFVSGSAFFLYGVE